MIEELRFNFALHINNYNVKPGRMEAWLKEWREKIYTLRIRLGFKVLGAWVVPGRNRFVWIIGRDGKGTLEDANKAYYDSPERKSMKPDPSRHLSRVRHHLMSSVL